jgi:hypothetical protein
LEKLREEIGKISRILHYPVDFEKIADESTTLEKAAFHCSDNRYEKYDAYVALVCAMLKCNEQLEELEERFESCSSSEDFMWYWSLER